ncbi:MAG: autotransporter-associated beta strand repeat-containing protein [Chthoniobacterales bacterium]
MRTPLEAAHANGATNRKKQTILGCFTELWALCLVATLCLAFSTTTWAGVKTWGNTGTDFNDANSWVGGKLPKVTDSVDFSGPEVTNPNLSASFELLAISFSATDSSSYTLSSSSPAIKLTLDSVTNGSTSAIYTANTSGTNTISAPVVFGAAAGSTQTVTIGSGGTMVISGVISSTNNVTIAKEGAGTLTLSGTNTYAGGTALNAGTLNINNASALGTGAFTIASGSNGVIDNTTAGAITLTTNNAQAWNGDFTFTGTQSLNLGTGAVTLGASRTVTVNANNLTVGGVISGSGFGLTKAGNGALTLSGANTYTGGTTLNAGTLNINSATALGTGAFTINGGTINNTTAGAITLTNNNAITLGANFTFGGTQNLNLGTGAITNAGNRTITLNGTNSTLTLGGIMTNTSGAAQTTTVNGAGNTLSLGGYTLSSQSDVINGTGNVNIAGVISDGGKGAGSLTYGGGGVLTFGGANTYTGGTTLSSGTLNINNAGSGGKSSAIGKGTLTINGGTIDNTSGGAIALSTNNNVTVGGNFAFGGTNNLDFGGGKVSSGGNYTITLNGTNSTLTFGGGLNSTLSVGQTTTVNGAGNTLSLGGYTLNSGNQVDTINGSGNVNITGVVSSGGKSTGSGLTYSGTGVLTFGGANTYTGATTVNSGTLLVNGSTASGSAVSVNNSGTTLGGTGTINGNVTVGNGAILLGGTGNAASGTLTLANSLTLNSGSIIELALGASGAHSTLARTGSSAWTFSSGQAFSFINLGAQPGIYDNIITGLASNPGGESSWTITNAGWIGSFTWDGMGNIDLNVVAVPEPATWFAGFLALAALGYHERRRWLSLFRRSV